MKKFLSLVLALIMTFSLVTISAGAKDFTDDEKITYKEAVDVISAVKVVDGYTDGSFKPTDTLSRGAAAKIICNLILGPTTASALSADTAPYSDVPVGSTFAGYIAFCQKQKIISGYADGTFRPSANLTGYAFMKMLLGALGYDAKVEQYENENWSINVAKRALNLKLNKGLVGEFVGTKAVTREEACLYAFNTLQATMVEYDTTITIGDITVAGSKASEVANNSKTAETIKADGKLQFAEKFFTDLKLNDNATDDFARPSNEWKVKSEKVGTYPHTPDATYTAKVENGDIYSDLGSKVAKDDVTVYVNGVEQPSLAVAIAKGGDTTVGESANGVLTELYYDKDAETLDIIQIHTYVGTVDRSVKATSSKDAYIVIGDEGSTAPASNLTYETDEKYDDDTVILYTYSASAKEVQSVAVADEVTGTVTRAENKKTNGEESQNVTIDGTVYKAAKKFAGDEVSDITVKEEYTVYLDSYGYMIKIEKVADLSSDYALILNTDTNSNNNVNSGFSGSKRAKLVFTDGTVAIVSTVKNYNSGSNAIANGTIVTYRKDADGVYTLRPVSTTASTTNDAQFEMLNNRAQIVITAADGVSTTSIYGNSATAYVVYNNDDDGWDAYIGAKAAPGVAAKDLNSDSNILHANKETVTAYYYVKNGIIKAIFIIPDQDALVDTTGSKLLYIAGGSVSNLVHDADGDYFEYDAIVDGEIKTIKVDYDQGKSLNGFYSSYSIDKYGIYDNLQPQAAAPTGTPNGTSTYFHTITGGIAKYNEEYTVKFGSNTYTVDDDADIYYVDEDDNITVSSYKSITKDTNDEVFAIVKDNMVQTLIIVAVDDDATNVPNINTDNYKVTYTGTTVSDILYYTTADHDVETLLDVILNDLTDRGVTDLKVAQSGDVFTITGTRNKVTYNYTWNSSTVNGTEAYKISVDGVDMLVNKTESLSTLAITGSTYYKGVKDDGTAIAMASISGVTVADGYSYETGFVAITVTGSVTNTLTGSTDSSATITAALKSGTTAYVTINKAASVAVVVTSDAALADKAAAFTSSDGTVSGTIAKGADKAEVTVVLAAADVTGDLTITLTAKDA